MVAPRWPRAWHGSLLLVSLIVFLRLLFHMPTFITAGLLIWILSLSPSWNHSCDILTGLFCQTFLNLLGSYRGQCYTSIFKSWAIFLMTDELTIIVKFWSFPVYNDTQDVVLSGEIMCFKCMLAVASASPFTGWPAEDNNFLVFTNAQTETHQPTFQPLIPAERGHPAGGSRAEQLPGWGGRGQEPHRQRSDPRQEGCHVSPGEGRTVGGGLYTMSHTAYCYVHV